MTFWQPLANALLSALAARRCAACRELIDTPLDGAVCDGCWRRVHPFAPPVCRRCGDPLPSWRVASVHAETCARCRRTPPIITRGAAVGAYDGALRDIVHALKYDGRRSVTRPLAQMMAQHAAHVLHGADAVVPVPLHPRRERQRGFNQAHDLAAALGLPVLTALRRTHATRPQVELPSAMRHRNVRDAFALSRRPGSWLPLLATGNRKPGTDTADNSVRGLTLVLVDDVATTGATLHACARVLKEAGAREVRAVTAARVVSVRP